MRTAHITLKQQIRLVNSEKCLFTGNVTMTQSAPAAVKCNSTVGKASSVKALQPPQLCSMVL